MTAALRTAGLPNVAVAVATPAPALAGDVAAFNANPTQRPASLSFENMLSPDPTVPRPVATVSFGASGAPLPGILAPPDLSGGYVVQDAEVPVWRQSIMSAAKMVVARGSTLTGVAFRLRMPSRLDLGRPDLYVTVPDPAVFRASVGSATLPAAAVETEMRAAIPTWATTVTFTTTNSIGGERRITLTVSEPVAQFAAFNIEELVSSLLLRQVELNKRGGGIGSVVVRVADPTGTPLYTYAGDATWGQNHEWASPIVRAWIDGLMTLPPVP